VAKRIVCYQAATYVWDFGVSYIRLSNTAILSDRNMQMRYLIAAFVVCAIAFVAADEPKKKVATTLKGKWSLVSVSHGGKAAPADVIKDFKFTFEEKTYNNVMNGETLQEGEYKFDDGKSPKTIDFDIKKGHNEGKKQVGIFKIEDDKITIVLAEPDATDRPTSFEVKEGSNVIEAVLERVKP
jgi:uncharacterized protein (TIGR03067 family)